jgi:carboxypeptidase Q
VVPDRLVVLAPILIAVAAAGCGPHPAPSPPAAKPRWWQKATPSAEVPVATAAAPTPPPAKSPVVGGSISAEQREIAARILERAVADRGAYEKLRHLTDRIGHRLAGSPQLDQAIAWAADAMKKDGHEVRTEKVMVPHWVRGFEAGELIAPVKRPLNLLGLGNTIATPKGGITARVVVVKNLKELEDKNVKGAIVLVDGIMAPWTPEGGSGYGPLAEVRYRGGMEIAKRGGVAMLIRSLTAHSLQTPHTGGTAALPGVKTVPAAALSIEDAALVARLAEQGDVTIKLTLSGKMLPDAPSANVIGELRGRDKPDEVVLIGAHIDSWDVGQGAHDDGAGCVKMMQAITILRQLGLQPRRTIRVVLFTNEENGLRGGRGYAEAHKAELGKHIVAMESDSGGFAPLGFRLEVPGDDQARRERVRARVQAIASLLAPVGATRIVDGEAGADVGPMIKGGGVIGLGVDVEPATYFDYHHTHADTLDKVVPEDLARNVGAVAVMAYLIADLPVRLDE